MSETLYDRPDKQKFAIGQRVRIADDLGDGANHFPRGCDATVMGSYTQLCAGTDDCSYSLDIDGRGRVSWYTEGVLTALGLSPTDQIAALTKERDALLALR